MAAPKPALLKEILDTSTPANRSPFSRGLQRETKRAAVLSCAAKLFNTKGARSTTLADVASRLGLTKTSLYYYVATKEDLIYQCYDANMRQAHDQLDRAEETHEGAIECLMAFLESQINTTLRSLDGEGDFYAAPLEVASLKAEHREVLEEEYRRLLRRLIDLLNRGIEAGQIRPCNPVITIRAIIGALDWSFYWLYEMPREQARGVVNALRDLLTHGLMSSPERPAGGDAAAIPPFSPEDEAFDREAQNRLKQEAFLKAGTRCFNQKGFSGTSLDEIAEQLQVSKGAFYYHFANKEALLTQCFDYTLDQLEQVVARIEQLEAPAAAKLETACRHIFALQNSDQGPLVHFNAITALPPEVRQRLLARLASVHATLENYVALAAETLEFRDIPPGIVIQLLTGALNAAMDLDAWQPIDDINHSAGEYFSVFFSGLASPTHLQ
ncbi:MAG: TetR/AcrR family transcriptional regulator [Halieaceae bacterium]|nr:MAG: TetR/AcrR family transcriptional regulator [Halieaceae bacterium]